VFAKRAALGEGPLWTAYRWGYYAGSLGRHLIGQGHAEARPNADAPAA
jgi:hypothetical protein